MVMFFASLSLVTLAHTFMTTTRTAILALLLCAILLPVFYLFQRRKQQSLSLRVWITTGIATITVAILIIGSLAVFPPQPCPDHELSAKNR